MGIDNISRKQGQEHEGEAGARMWMKRIEEKAEDLARADRTTEKFRQTLTDIEAGKPIPLNRAERFDRELFEEAHNRGITPEMWSERMAKSRTAEATIATFRESIQSMTATDLEKEYMRVAQEIKGIDRRFVHVYDRRIGGKPVAQMQADVEQIGGGTRHWFMLQKEEDVDAYFKADVLTREREDLIRALARERSLEKVYASDKDWSNEGVAA